jgi:hypothetical protein
VVLLHHPLVDGAVSARKALRDRGALRAVLQRAGAELVLHGHARQARLEAVPGPQGPIPVLCVPSSTALPNRHDEAARWHLVTLPAGGAPRWAHVLVRQWSLAKAAFVDAAAYDLRLPDAEIRPRWLVWPHRKRQRPARWSGPSWFQGSRGVQTASSMAQAEWLLPPLLGMSARRVTYVN